MSYRRGRFSVISAITSASIDLGYLSDRVDDIPSVEWLVSRVATAMEWPEDFVVLSAAAGVLSTGVLRARLQVGALH
jgi:hypothetical protein